MVIKKNKKLSGILYVISLLTALFIGTIWRQNTTVGIIFSIFPITLFVLHFIFEPEKKINL